MEGAHQASHSAFQAVDIYSQVPHDIELGTVRPGLCRHRHPRHIIPCVAVKKWGNTSWDPLGEISAKTWMENREQITKSVNKQYSFASAIMTEMEECRKGEQVKNEAIELMTKMYERLSVEEKKAFIRVYRHTFLGRHTCSICLKYCVKKNPCIHPDCSGMCDSCYKNLIDQCPACGKEQTLICPICQEEKSSDELVNSSTCYHSVCWKCYGMAFRCGHPILKCPVCRGIFTTSHLQKGRDPVVSPYLEDAGYDSSDFEGQVYPDESTSSVS